VQPNVAAIALLSNGQVNNQRLPHIAVIVGTKTTAAVAVVVVVIMRLIVVVVVMMR